LAALAVPAGDSRRPGRDEEYGVMFDAMTALDLPGFSATVFLTNLFEIRANSKSCSNCPGSLRSSEESKPQVGASTDHHTHEENQSVHGTPRRGCSRPCARFHGRGRADQVPVLARLTKQGLFMHCRNEVRHSLPAS
jgi:hypothetical protein